MATVEQLNQLRRSVDDARELAIKLDMTMTAYILAMACLEIAEVIDGMAGKSDEAAESHVRLGDDSAPDH